jgi:subtilisin family serine protease
VGEDGRVAPFSSGQRFRRAEAPLVPALVAPGVDVLSCIPGGGYARKSGTSMATLHVAGLAALLFEARPSAEAAEVEAALFATCGLPEGRDSERANRGIPNGPAALAALTGAAAGPGTGARAGPARKGGAARPAARGARPKPKTGARRRGRSRS